MQMIDCGCGCKEIIPAFDKKGRPRQYVVGHHNFGKKLSQERKNHLSKIHMGSNNPQWNPNKVLHYRDGRNFTRLQTRILKGPICVGCGTTKRLALDHIIPIFAGGGNMDSNAQTLCVSCNSKKYHEERVYYKKLREFREPLNPFYGKDNPDPSQKRNLLEGATTRSRDCKRSKPKLKLVYLVCDNCHKLYEKVAYMMRQKAKHIFCGTLCRWDFYSKNKDGKGRYVGNTPKSAQPERDDIVWTCKKLQEV